MDRTVDIAAMFKDFDTVLMGRRTYELARKGPGTHHARYADHRLLAIVEAA